MVRHFLKILQQMLQDFQVVPDHFGTLGIKRLNGWDSLTETVLTTGHFICFHSLNLDFLYPTDTIFGAVQYFSFKIQFSV